MMIDNFLEELPATLILSGKPTFRADEINAYCVKCKTCYPMSDPQLVTTRSGKSAARGKCPVCHTTMMKFLPNRYV